MEGGKSRRKRNHAEVEPVVHGKMVIVVVWD